MIDGKAVYLIRFVNLSLTFFITFFLIAYSAKSGDEILFSAVSHFMFLSSFLPWLMLGLNKTTFTILRFEDLNYKTDAVSAYFTFEMLALIIAYLYVFFC